MQNEGKNTYLSGQLLVTCLQPCAVLLMSLIRGSMDKKAVILIQLCITSKWVRGALSLEVK